MWASSAFATTDGAQETANQMGFVANRELLGSEGMRETFGCRILQECLGEWRFICSSSSFSKRPIFSLKIDEKQLLIVIIYFLVSTNCLKKWQWKKGNAHEAAF